MKTTFLNGDLKENVYMDQPMGFSVEGREHMMCKLKISIYGLKQASGQWYLKFNNIIVSFGFKENIVDRCIYLKVSGSKVMFLILMLMIYGLQLMILVLFMRLRSSFLVTLK